MSQKEKPIIHKSQILAHIKNGKYTAISKLERKQTITFALIVLMSLITLGFLTYILLGLIGITNIKWLWDFLDKSGLV